MIDGNLVVCTVSRRVIALDPQTGKARWTYDPKSKVERYKKCRGVSHWVDTAAADGAICKSRIFLGTLDYRLIAIDAMTGKLCEGFGDNGEVRSEEHTSELQSLMRISYAISCFQKTPT